MKDAVIDRRGEVRARVRSRRAAWGGVGFTLIEMLIVLAVIAVLIGIALRLAGYVNVKVGKARAAAQVEQVRLALAEYYAEYGSYPPATKSVFEYENTNFMPAGPPEDAGYVTGLLYYLGYGRQGTDSKYYNPNPAAARWQHLLRGVEYWEVTEAKSNATSMGWERWHNWRHTLKDPWDRDYQYVCIAPYQSYKLWSVGPNGTNEQGRGDDIGVGWAE